MWHSSGLKFTGLAPGPAIESHDDIAINHLIQEEGLPLTGAPLTLHKLAPESLAIETHLNVSDQLGRIENVVILTSVSRDESPAAPGHHRPALMFSSRLSRKENIKARAGNRVPPQYPALTV